MTENKNNMKVAVLLVIIAATMSSASQLLWKIGADAKSSGLAILLLPPRLCASGAWFGLFDRFLPFWTCIHHAADDVLGLCLVDYFWRYFLG